MNKLKLTLLGLLICIMGAISANASRYNIPKNYTVTSKDPNCKWEVSGWIDYSTKWGLPPIKIDHYDITLNGPCGKLHFTGKVIKDPTDPTTPNIHEYTITDENDNPVTLLPDAEVISIIEQLDAFLPEE